MTPAISSHSAFPVPRSPFQRVLLIVPTYNERDNLSELVKRLPAIDGLELLFIDDHSPDGTADWIRNLAQSRPGVHLLERPAKLGLGTAYIAGFKWALERNFDLVFEMDADLSHDPAEIQNFIHKIEEGADLVIGSRYLGGISRVVNWPLNRLALSRFGGMYARFWTGLPITDPTSGYKCFHRKVIEAVRLDAIRSNGYAFQIEMDYYAWRKGFRLAEIPIIFTERREGSSKMNRHIVFEAVWMVPWLRLKWFLGM